jgi:hypothetical protein
MPVRKPLPDPVETDVGVATETTAGTTEVGLPQLLHELHEFVRGVPVDTAYHELASVAWAAGWMWKMTEFDCHVAAPGFVMVRFSVEVGHKDRPYFEDLDTISMMVPQEAPSPSLFARLNAQVALTYMIFGRLPPQPQAPAAAESAVEEDRYGETHIEDAPAPEPEIPWRANEPKPRAEIPKLIQRRTPDGLPVMIDPYPLDGIPATELATAIMVVFDDNIDAPGDRAGVTAMWTKNQSAASFVMDFGTAEEKKRLSTMFREKAASFAA